MSEKGRPARTYAVRADWDAEAEVWVAFSDEVPGLATEAGTLEALTEKLRTLIPELLEANHVEVAGAGREISFEIVGHRRERLRMASQVARTYTPRLKKLLREHGCRFERQGKGDHEIWYSPITDRRFVVG